MTNLEIKADGLWIRVSKDGDSVILQLNAEENYYLSEGTATALAIGLLEIAENEDE